MSPDEPEIVVAFAKLSFAGGGGEDMFAVALPEVTFTS